MLCGSSIMMPKANTQAVYDVYFSTLHKSVYILILC